MSHASFVHLRVHTAYSLAEGAITVKDLIKRCEAEAMPAVAMTDTGNMFGGLEFAVTASGAGVQPIVGVQLAITREAEPDTRPFKVVGGTSHISPEPDQLVLLAATEAGYLNLMKLVSQAFLETDGSEMPQVPMDALDGATDGVIALSGGPKGAIGRFLLEGREDDARAMASRLASLFPGRLYIELQRHFLPEERKTESGFLDIAYDLDLPLVATNECFFPATDQYEAHDALLCIAEGTQVGRDDRRRLTPHHRFKSPEEMRELFADVPEAVDNTLVIARRCAYMPKKIAPILPPYATEGGRDEAAELRAQSEAGLRKRLDAHVYTADMDEAAREAAAKPYLDRLDMELSIITQMGFPGYFLIVADFIQWGKAHGIPIGPGRGSGAGSVVAWVLLITDLDPLRWGLLFERFLNPERVSMPDFDIDFCQDRRGEVIDYVQKKYGRDKVAQIITFGKLQARAVLRDVGRVLEMPYGQVDRICKLVPNNPANPVTLAQAIQEEPELRRQRDDDEQVAHLLRLGLQLEGLYRNASTHAAGVVIGDRPLHELVPLYQDPRSDMPATQFNMKWVESAGLVKFDFLGLKTLSILRTAQGLLEKRGIHLDLDTLPLDDAPTFEMLGRGDSTGVFQLESSGMRDVLRKLKPDRFEDIIALVALYRPGPMANIPKYIACKHGEEQPDYMHPKLQPVLTETFGIMIYQEQVQQAAQVLAGYTLGGADLLRRAMGKKIKAEMDAQRETFVKGSVDNGVDSTKASEIFDQIAAFAGYGFNKSHAAAYALISYQTAYMKANHPVEFMAASMTYDMANSDKLNVFRQELQKTGVKLLKPDVNRSEDTFSVEQTEEGDLAVRYALAAIKNVGKSAMEWLVAERQEKPFKDLSDFANRVDTRQINKRLVENLVRAGAFDSLHGNRAELVEGADVILRHANAASESRSSNQASLFAGGGDESADRIRLESRPEWTTMERLNHEFDALGFYLSAHPLDAYDSTLKKIGVVQSNEIEMTLAANKGSARLNLAGIVVNYRVRTSQKGSRYAFIEMTDRAGVFEAVVFSEVLATSRELLDSGQPVMLRADARLDEGTARLAATKIEALDAAASKSAAGLQIFLTSPDPVPHLASILGKYGRGKGSIRIAVQTPTEQVDIALSDSFRIDPKLRAAVKSLPGVMDVHDL